MHFLDGPEYRLMPNMTDIWPSFREYPVPSRRGKCLSKSKQRLLADSEVNLVLQDKRENNDFKCLRTAVGQHKSSIHTSCRPRNGTIKHVFVV